MLKALAYPFPVINNEIIQVVLKMRTLDEHRYHFSYGVHTKIQNYENPLIKEPLIN